ncbi:hypothetical protein GCM10028895_46160 [Pontibacter rugosus]
MMVERDGKTIEVNAKMLEQEAELKHQFKVNEQASQQQLALRQAWMKNL